MITARLITKDDSEEFVKLLNRVYGDTYSYSELYSSQGYESFLEKPGVFCFGSFDEESRMIGHTCVTFSDPKNNYAESGMSMRKPFNRAVSRNTEVETWETILDFASKKTTYLHCNTTTYHSFAQRYAKKILSGKFTCLIFDYAQGEKLRHINHIDRPMLALTLTTILKPTEKKRVLIPENSWANWLISILNQFNRLSVVVKPKNEMLTLNVINENNNLKLTRYIANKYPTEGFNIKEVHTSSLNVLINLPLDGCGFDYLLELGYLPVGIRPHHTRTDEVVFQHFTEKSKEAVSKTISNAKIYSTIDKNFINEWLAICKRIM